MSCDCLKHNVAKLSIIIIKSIAVGLQNIALHKTILHSMQLKGSRRRVIKARNILTL